MNINELTLEEISEELTKLEIPHSTSWEKEKLEDLLIEALSKNIKKKSEDNIDKTNDEAIIENKETLKKKAEDVENEINSDKEDIEKVDLKDEESKRHLRVKNIYIFNIVFFGIFLIISIALFVTAHPDTIKGVYNHGTTNEINIFVGSILIILAVFNFVSFILNLIANNSKDMKFHTKNVFNRIGIIATLGIPLIFRDNKEDKKDTNDKK